MTKSKKRLLVTLMAVETMILSGCKQKEMGDVLSKEAGALDLTNGLIEDINTGLNGSELNGECGNGGCHFATEQGDLAYEYHLNDIYPVEMLDHVDLTVENGQVMDGTVVVNGQAVQVDDGVAHVLKLK